MLNPREPRTAFVHDWIDTYGGAERVVECLYDELRPEEFFTLLANKESKLTKKIGQKLKTSWLQNIPFSFSWHRHLLALYPLAVEGLNLSNAELVLSSSHCVAKNVLTRSDQLHICYVHSPARYLWDQTHAYLMASKITGVKRLFVESVFSRLRTWDFAASSRVDLFIANSQNIARRIWRAYRRPSYVVYPFVDLEKFALSEEKRDSYFVVISRLVTQKRVDIAVEACSKLGVSLKIIGNGPELKKLQSISGPTIEFLGALDHDALYSVLRKSAALLFTSDEDFGIVPLEAQAVGIPVIALGRGGALETVLAGKTGEFFADQTAVSLANVIRNFDSSRYESRVVRNQAERFSKEQFILSMRTVVSSAWQKFQNDRIFMDAEFLDHFEGSHDTSVRVR